jgi:hypothetical protein
MRLAEERRLDNQLWRGRGSRQQQTTIAGCKTRTSNESGWQTMMTSNESGWRTAAWQRRAAGGMARVGGTTRAGGTTRTGGATRAGSRHHGPKLTC